MARQVTVVALVFVAIIGLASAEPGKTPRASGAPPAANAPEANAATPRSAKAPSASGAAPAANAPKAKASTPSGAVSQAPAGAPGSAPPEDGSPAAGKMPDVAMPGPVGSPGNTADAPEGSGASTLRVSAIVVGVAVACFFH